MYSTSKHLGVKRKILWRFDPATFTPTDCYANHSATKTCYMQGDIKSRSRIASESNLKNLQV